MSRPVVALTIACALTAYGYWIVDNKSDAEYLREIAAKECADKMQGDTDIVTLTFSTSADMHTTNGRYVSCTRYAERPYVLRDRKLTALVNAHRGMK